MRHRQPAPATPQSPPSPQRLAALVGGLYLLFGVAWIAFSDRIALELAASHGGLSHLQTLKGIAYVLVTGLLLYAAVFYFTSRLARSQRELHEHGEHLARLNRAHEILSSVGDLLLHGSDDRLLLESTARAVVERGGFPLVWIALYDHEQRRLTPAASASPGALSRGPGEPLTLGSGDRSIVTAALYRGRMQAAAADELVDRLLPSDQAYAAVAAFPLRGGGDTRGVLVIHTGEPDLFADEEETMLLSRVADTVALGLDYSRQRQRLDQLDYHDPVTGVGNRNLIENRLAAALNHAAQRETAVAMLVLDIDAFRRINELGGYAAGDRALARVGDILGGVIRPGDTIGRLGNDEFGIVFHELPRAEQVSRLVNRVADRFPAALELDGLELELSVSIGIAVYPDDAQDPAELLSRAEVALHNQPPEQQGAITYYAPEFDRRASEQRALENALRNAEFDDEFRLAWQPVVDIRAGALCAAEVLLRWHNPGLGEIPPARFIPLAEQSGRIRVLGERVLAHACEQGRAWADAGRPLDIAVNIALEQLQDPEFVPRVRRLLARHAGDWTLILELTESQFMAEPEPVGNVCRQLREAGCRIHLDDFGTGYSALNYLVHLPLDGIKLDRSFVQQIADDPGVHAITEAVVSLAERLGLEVIAEGVETERQLEIVRALGARNIQGYLFGRPMPAHELDRLGTRGLERLLAN